MLCDFMVWTEDDFLRNTEGTSIRRIGFERWQRNVAVALGNGPASTAALQSLQTVRQRATALVREHIDWALMRLSEKPQ